MTRKPKCYVTFKSMFSEETAKLLADKYINSVNTARPLRAYRCEFCESWHLTHKKSFMS